VYCQSGNVRRRTSAMGTVRRGVRAGINPLGKNGHGKPLLNVFQHTAAGGKRPPSAMVIRMNSPVKPPITGNRRRVRNDSNGILVVTPPPADVAVMIVRE